MNLVHDWNRIAKKAYSFRLAIIAGLLSAVTTIMAVMVTRESDPLFLGAFIVVSMAASVAGFLAAAARLTAQPKMYAPDAKTDPLNVRINPIGRRR